MRKKYVSPLVEALALELEDVLFDSESDNINDADEPGWDDMFGEDFDQEDDFNF